MNMQIDLHNFFKFYDEKNPKHVAAVEELEKTLRADKPDLMLDSSNWVRIYRSSPGILLNVPWFPQTDNAIQPNRTCNSSACAMCLEYFKPGTLIGPKGDDAYIEKVFSVGDTTDHLVQTRVLASYGIESSFSYTLGFVDLDRELAAGRPVVIGILHRGPLSAPVGGHMIVVVGKTAQGDYIVNDPFGNLMTGYSTSVIEGKGAIYPVSVLRSRWLPEGPNSGWGRIFSAKK